MLEDNKRIVISAERRCRVLAELMSVAKRIEKRRNKQIQSKDEWRQQFDQILNEIFIVRTDAKRRRSK